jgi:hypothetical protein|tara:strand:- start:3157 stop:3405 length:249 start_codon:yes stop_codon:yes gene_type:complete
MKKTWNKVLELTGRSTVNDLDLTSKSYLYDNRHQYVGLEIRRRAYKRPIVALAILTLIITSFIPGPNVLGLYLVKPLLWRWG